MSLFGGILVTFEFPLSLFVGLDVNNKKSTKKILAWSEPPLLGNASIFPKLVSATLPSARAIGGMHFVICIVWQR